MTTVVTSRPASQNHLEESSTNVIGTIKVARARAKQISPSIAMKRTFQAGMQIPHEMGTDRRTKRPE